MKKLVTIITFVAACGFANADGPKFKSYAEMQAERAAKADAASVRFAAERAASDKIAQENALAKAAHATQLKAEREEQRKKMAIAAAGAPKVSVGLTQVVW